MLLPDIWGQGAIFSFSGIEGETSYKEDLVASLSGDRLGLIFHLRQRRELFFHIDRIIKDINYRCVTSDLILADLINRLDKSVYPLCIVFLNRSCVIGETTRYAIPKVTIEDGEVENIEDGALEYADGEYTALVTKSTDQMIRFAFSYSQRSKEEAIEIARKGLEIDINREIENRLEFFRRLPKPNVSSSLLEKTFYKCFSVLKANIMSKEGNITCRWTTPDRIPHRNMWLWDSVFHSLALKYISPELAYESLKAVLDTQKEDGFIPHMSSPYHSSDITQPPLLAWGFWKLYNFTKDKEVIRENFPKLKKYLEWNLKNRDANKNYLCEWHIEENPMSRSGESGMDNSPRFDKALVMDAVDFSSFMANDIECLIKMAEILGYKDEKSYLENIYEKIKENINLLLWDDDHKFYYDRTLSGSFNKIKTVASFTPLFAGVVDQKRAEYLVEHLLDKEEFATEFPVPSTAKNEPSYSTDLWRGPTWINYNYLIIKGLKRYGYDELAEDIAKKTIYEIAHWYQEEGVIFEYYDSSKKRKPSFLDRKGPCNPPYDIRRKIFPIRDYGWTASIFITLLIEE